MAFEVKKMGVSPEKVTVRDGKVCFLGDLSMIVRANLWLRTAERVLVVLGEFSAHSFTELFDHTESLPFEAWIGKQDAFPVKGWSLNSKLHSVPDCQKIIKKAVVKRLQRTYHVGFFEETGSTHQIQFSILKDQVQILLDTSGEGLHKRGYRRHSTLAPIKETLAAGILDLARVRRDTTLYDPMCGSGTFLIEGALRAQNIAPGLRRRFAAERWAQIPSAIWREEKTRALDLVEREVTFEAIGSDIDSEAIELTLQNAKNAGVIAHVKAHRADVKDFKARGENAVIVCNPPYGERLMDQKASEALYQILGKVIFPGEKAYFITSHEEFESFFGRRANRRRKLYNGMLKCQLYMYF